MAKRGRPEVLNEQFEATRRAGQLLRCELKVPYVTVPPSVWNAYCIRELAPPPPKPTCVAKLGNPGNRLTMLLVWLNLILCLRWALYRPMGTLWRPLYRVWLTLGSEVRPRGRERGAS